MRDGKIIAIIVFFNIIRSVTVKDNYRFILITEQQKKGKAESTTDWFPRSWETIEKVYDNIVDNTFRYVFSCVTDHIKVDLFILKSN